MYFMQAPSVRNPAALSRKGAGNLWNFYLLSSPSV